MADTEQDKSKKELLYARLQERYPELDMEDEEAVNGRIHDDYDEYENKMSGYEDELGRYKENESKLVDVLNSNGPGAEFLCAMARGEDPWESLVKQIGIDGVKEMLEDPKSMEKYSASNKEYLERVAKHKELEEEWQSNMSGTLEMLAQKRDELGLTDEQIDSACDLVRDIVNDAVIGIIRPETLDLALKALNYDADVAEAGVEGEIRGKNAKVDAELRRPQAEDGVPMLGGASVGAQPAKRNSIFELADGAK